MAQEMEHDVAGVAAAVDVGVSAPHAAVDGAKERCDVVGGHRILASSQSHQELDPNLEMGKHDGIISRSSGEGEVGADAIIFQVEGGIAGAPRLQEVQAGDTACLHRHSLCIVPQRDAEITGAGDVLDIDQGIAAGGELDRAAAHPIQYETGIITGTHDEGTAGGIAQADRILPRSSGGQAQSVGQHSVQAQDISTGSGGKGNVAGKAELRQGYAVVAVEQGNREPGHQAEALRISRLIYRRAYPGYLQASTGHLGNGERSEEHTSELQ